VAPSRLALDTITCMRSAVVGAPTTLEATQGQFDGFFCQLPYKCHHNRLASVGDGLKIFPWVASRADRDGWGGPGVTPQRKYARDRLEYTAAAGPPGSEKDCGATLIAPAA